MSHPTIIKSLADLPQLLPFEELAAEATVDVAVRLEQPAYDVPRDLTALLAELEAASAALAAVARRDQEGRASALRDLERHDALVAERDESLRIARLGRQVRLDAEALIASAFADEARNAARGVADVAIKAEASAQCLADEREREATALAARLDLDRLLAARQREEEAEKTRAAAAERAGRLSGALAEAEAALRAGRLEEAKALLGSIVEENPANAEIACLQNMIAERELAVKITAAEDALWTARREYRREPAQAVNRLAALDVTGLPELLTRQIFGAWARACARLCRERGLAEPVRYAPDPGRGAVLARESAGAPYSVVSALGMGPTWQVGSPVGERQVRRARPLRAG